MSVQPIDESQAVVVYRMRRWGQDRAYVKVGDVQLGYRDLRSGEVRCLLPENREFVGKVTDGLYDRASERARASSYRPRHSAQARSESDDVVAPIVADEPVTVVEPERTMDFGGRTRPHVVAQTPLAPRRAPVADAAPREMAPRQDVPRETGRQDVPPVTAPRQDVPRVTAPPQDIPPAAPRRRISDAEDRARRQQFASRAVVTRMPVRDIAARPVTPPVSRTVTPPAAPPAAPPVAPRAASPATTQVPPPVERRERRPAAVENKVWGDVPQRRRPPLQSVSPDERTRPREQTTPRTPAQPYDTTPNRPVVAPSGPILRPVAPLVETSAAAREVTRPRREVVEPVWGTICEPPKREPAFEARTRHDVDLSAGRPGRSAVPRTDDLLVTQPSRRHVPRTRSRAAERRAWGHGEQEIGHRLGKLGDGWRVLHCVPVGNRGGDVDHVVIGPAGVFVINDKAHPGCSVWVRNDTFKVNDVTLNYVRHSRHEARQTAALLTAAVGFDVTVRSIIAVVGAERGYSVREQPHDVAVTKADDVVRWLRKRQRVLDGATVELIYAAARRMSTWQTQAEWSEPRG